jgi:hypothetical protein
MKTLTMVKVNSVDDIGAQMEVISMIAGKRECFRAITKLELEIYRKVA